MSYDYDRQCKTARGTRLDSRVRRQANAALIRAGLDGNGRFRKIGEALAKAFDVLNDFGIEPDEVLSAHKFPEAKGRANVELAFKNPEDPFSPEPIANSMLAIQWTELTPGRVEAVAYLS